MFVQAIVFLILAFSIAKFVWPPMMAALDARAKKIADGLAAADQGKQAMAAAQKTVQAELATARDEGQKRIADAEKRGNALVEEAKAEAARIIAQAKADAEQQVTKAREELRAQVAGLAVKGAEQILKREVNAAAHADLLSQLATEL